ncbi:MAG: aldo/keto reductase [Steroidobacteraceae bacterium]
MNFPNDILGVPGRIGLGTNGLGDSVERHDQDVAAVKFALDIGYRLIDTAGMYGNGGAERVIGSALAAFGAARRSEVFIISKVYPENASRTGTVKACEASIERLGSKYIDLYLLHWRGSHPFAETLRGFDELLERKLVRNFGVSNFDVDDLQEWRRAERQVGVRATAKANEVSYSVDRRGMEYGQLDWQRAHGIQAIAYGPLRQGDLPQHPVLVELGRKRGVSPAQIAIAWCLRVPDMIVIPKSAHPQRIEDNFRAADVRLSPEELHRIDQAWPLRHRWLKGNPLLRHARSAARRLIRIVKKPASRTVDSATQGNH